MRVIAPSFEILGDVDGREIIKRVEYAGRVCYKSEEKISEGSAEKFIAHIVKNGHESVLEHEKISVKIVCDRGVSHEIVRHRIASYSQESTRYCNYALGKFGGELTFIRPYFWEENSELFAEWKKAMQAAEDSYVKLLGLGAAPEEARSVLPNSLKTEIVVSMDLREWRHFLKLRTDIHSHPQIREVARPLLAELQKRVPIVFDDITY